MNQTALIKMRNTIPFLTGLILAFVYIALPKYFLTNDGPCHVYNSFILKEFLTKGGSATFFSQFYTAAYVPNPNWMSHIMLAIFQLAFSGPVSEKLFLLCYTAIYVSGFSLLLRRLSGSYQFSFLVFLFLFHHALCNGFYNFSLSIALSSWLWLSWLRYLEKGSIGRFMPFALLLPVVFFSHLFMFLLSGMICLSLAFSYAASTRGVRGTTRRLLTQIGALAVCFLPLLVLGALFTAGRGGIQLKPGWHPYRLVELLQLKYFVNVSGSELYLTTLLGCILLTLAVLSFTRVNYQNGIHKYDGFLFSLVVVGVLYIVMPDVVYGIQVMMTFRLQIILATLLVCVFGYRLQLPETTLIILRWLLTIVIAAIYLIRIFAMTEIANSCAEYLSAGRYIKPNSVVAAFNMAPSLPGVKGAEPVEREWPFMHAAQYLGTVKPLIFVDNYEATTSYFPLKWARDQNPYQSLNRENGIEGCPPFIDLDNYQNTSGKEIDYILFWCFDSVNLRNKNFYSLYKTIHDRYNEVYIGNGGKTLLYELKGR